MSIFQYSRFVLKKGENSKPYYVTKWNVPLHRHRPPPASTHDALSSGAHIIMRFDYHTNNNLPLIDA